MNEVSPLTKKLHDIIYNNKKTDSKKIFTCLDNLSEDKKIELFNKIKNHFKHVLTVSLEERKPFFIQYIQDDFWKGTR
jgi:hypothetical protein